MTTQYACTFVEKSAEEDHYSNGCDPDTRVTIMSETCHIKANTLEGLVKAIGKRFRVDMDDPFIDTDDDGAVSRISYNRMETADGDAPTNSQLVRWERQELTLYFADYDFLIEKRTVHPIPLAEFETAGIKFHQ